MEQAQKQLYAWMNKECVYVIKQEKKISDIIII